MRSLHLNDDDATTLRCALQIARDRYQENAKDLRGMQGQERLAEQFEKQAADAERLIEQIDNA